MWLWEQRSGCAWTRWWPSDYPDPFTPLKIPYILESTSHDLPKKSEDTRLNIGLCNGNSSVYIYIYQRLKEDTTTSNAATTIMIITAFVVPAMMIMHLMSSPLWQNKSSLRSQPFLPPGLGKLQLFCSFCKTKM